MIPILYEKTETAFSSNGLGRLSDAIRCIVTEERNGIFECEFDYPVTGVYFDEIQIGRIIACTHDEQGDVQPFDIYAKSEPINGVVTFRAHHISYRLNEITVKPFTAGSCAEALSKIDSQSVVDNPFTFWTDKSVTASYTSEMPRNAKAMLGGEQNSILDVFGTGEYEFDKFDVKLYLHRGQDTNVSIRYGKNLIDMTNQYDAGDTYTAVVPFWLGDETVDDETVTTLVTLPEWILSSGQSVPSGREVIVPMDLSSEFSEKPSVSDLRTKAQSRLSSSDAWLPNQTVMINFVQLWQTEEYKDFAPLQRLRLCDTCGVFVPMYGMSLRAKVIKVVYNVLLDRYDEMELGDKPTTYTAVLEEIYDSKVAGVQQGLQAIKVDIQTVEQRTKTYTDAGLDALENELEEQIDAKLETWAQSTNPATAWTTAELKQQHNGDLWLYTGLSNLTVSGVTIVPQGVYQYNSSTNKWAAYSSTTDNLFDLVDGKTTIYYGSPSGSYTNKEVGDYLVDSTDGTTYRWSGTAWVKVTDYQTYTDNEIASAKTTIESEYEQAIEDATELIRGGTGGYIVTTVNANGQPIELLITDNLNLNQALNIWRWNLGGLAHSSNGYNGPFNDVAITQDGKINATMITTGILTANLIKAGILSDANDNTSLDLSTGVLTMKKGSINLGNGKFIATDAGVLTALGGGNIQDVTGDNYWNLTSGFFSTKNGAIGGFTIDSTSLYYQSSVRRVVFSSNEILYAASLSNNARKAVQLDAGQVNFLDRSDSSSWTLTEKAYINWSQTDQNLQVSSQNHIYFYLNGTVRLQMDTSTPHVFVNGGFACSGAKNRVIDTQNYSDRLLYCYETPTPLFGDIGEAVLDEEGLCYVDIDDIFTETIASKVEYQVFLQKEGEGNCWVADKDTRYFVIRGTPGLRVAWELKAKQRDYEMYRLEPWRTGLEEYAEPNDEDLLLNYINEQEELLYG